MNLMLVKKSSASTKTSRMFDFHSFRPVSDVVPAILDDDDDDADIGAAV